MKKELNVLFIANGFPRNDNESKCPFNLRAVQQISEYASIDVYTIRSWKPFNKIVENYVYKEIEVNCLNLPQIPFSNSQIPFSDSIAINTFSNFVNSIISSYAIIKTNKQYDLIHSVSIGLPSLIGARLSRKWGIPHIAQLIGTDVNMFLPQVYSLRLYRKMRDNISGVIANSQNLANEYRKLYPSDKELIVVYRGTDLSYFTYEFANVGNDLSGITFLFIGGFHPTKKDPEGNKKGGIDLLKAWIDYEDNLIKSNATLLIGGDNSNPSFLKKWLSQIKEKDSLRIIGTLKPYQVLTYMKESDVVIIPSINEGLPNVGMEAMACGIPVIGSNIGGLTEMIDEGVNGYLITVNDIEELGSTMLYVANNKHILKNLRVNARRHAEKYFDSRNYGLKIYNFYIRILNKGIPINNKLAFSE